MIAVLDPEQARVAAQLLRARRDRDALFGDDRVGFGEPGWDMLLALFVREASAEPMTWDAVVQEAGVAPAVAARYLEWLLSRELAVQHADHVGLSARGRDLMARYLSLGGS